MRQLEDLSEQALTLKSDYLHRFKMLYAISSKLGKFCYEAYKQIAVYVETKVSSKEHISLAIVQQIVYNKADEILEIPESTMWEACLKTSKSLTNELNTTLERIANESKTEKSKSYENMHVVRYIDCCQTSCYRCSSLGSTCFRYQG